MEHLVLPTNNLGSNGTMALIGAFQASHACHLILRNLKVLNLHTNGIGNDAVTELTDALSQGKLPSLQYVDLANNPVDVTVKSALAAARSGLVVR